MLPERVVLEWPVEVEHVAHHPDYDDIGGVATSPGRHHITVLHAGPLDLLRSEVRAMGGRDDEVEPRLRDGFTPLIGSGGGELAQVERLGTLTFGGTHFIVLFVRPTDEMRRVRSAAWDALIAALAACGIVDPEGFVRSSVAIDLASPTWNPHVTIRKRARAPLTARAIGGVARTRALQFHV